MRAWPKPTEAAASRSWHQREVWLPVPPGELDSRILFGYPVAMKLWMFLLLALWAILPCSLVGAENLEKLAQEKASGAIKVAYETHVLVKREGEIFAIHMELQEENKADAIAYSIFRLTEAGRFIPHREGKADEGNQGSGSVDVGPFCIEWSQRDLGTGWLYLGPFPDGSAFYECQFDSLDAVGEKLKPEGWLRTQPPQPPREQNHLAPPEHVPPRSFADSGRALLGPHCGGAFAAVKWA